MFIPGHERYTEMTPEEFENHSLNLLKMEASKFENSSFEHDVMMKSHDGTYQIDGKITFSYMGLSFVCLVECKRYKGPIKREKVIELHSKMQSLGAQKGIFVTTSYYQRGALLYAKEHGIALITITDEGLTYHRRASNLEDIHLPTKDGTLYVSVLTEVISENSYKDSFLYDETCNGLNEYLKQI